MNHQFDKLTRSLALSVTSRAARKKFGLGLAGMALTTVLFGAFAQAGPPEQTNSPIPWSQIGGKAGVDCKSDGLTVTATETGARLNCVFQRLDSEVTRESLWLMSTVPDMSRDRFQVVAVAIGNHHLARSGAVTVTGKMVKFSRSGLVEEYAVSMDGVRQDFVVESRPAGEALLRLELAVAGAKVEPSANSAQLVLPQSGRKIAYSGTSSHRRARASTAPSSPEAKRITYSLASPPFGKSCPRDDQQRRAKSQRARCSRLGPSEPIGDFQNSTSPPERAFLRLT